MNGFLESSNSVDVRSLGLVQRVLLVSDGTLTDIVEAAFGEPILLVKLALDVSPSATAVEELHLHGGEPVMRREILLQGAATGTNYVYAESLIVLQALPPKMREELVSTQQPLGRLWVEHKIETRKEILRVWRIAPGSDLAAAHFASIDPRRGLLARTYRVFSGGQPVMRISEYFSD